MDTPKQSIPSFFKILLDDSANYLPLPSVFVKTNFLKRKFPVNPVLQTESGGKWRVKIEEIGGKCCFGKGWIEFVNDTKTEAGDFLVFRLTGDSAFQVSIFAPNCCEKDLSLVAPTTINNRVCNRCFEIADLKGLIKIEDDDDDEDNDNEEENDEAAEEENDNELLPLEWMVQSDNPRIQKVLKKSHLASQMNLPMNLAMESEVGSPFRKAMLRNQAGKEWPVNIGRYRDGRIYLTGGWSDFWRENRLMEGDICSFQYFHGEGGGQTSFVDFELVHKVSRKRGRPRA